MNTNMDVAKAGGGKMYGQSNQTNSQGSGGYSNRGMGAGNSGANSRKQMGGVNNLTPSNTYLTGNFDFHDLGHTAHPDDFLFDGSENDGAQNGPHHYHKHASNGMGAH